MHLVLVISFRDDELPATHPLALTLGDLAKYPAVSRIELAASTLPAVASLAAGSGLNAEQLHHITGGNPCFVTEVLGVSSPKYWPPGRPR